MKGKEKYYKLDETGFAGTQKEQSAASKKYHAAKTAEIFKSEREKRTLATKPIAKKAS